MPIFLDTRGRSTLGIGICARCSCKMSLEELMPDPNAPGLMCCREDLDDLDPYRLPARQPDNLVLQFCRPDVNIDSPAPSPNLLADPFFGLTSIGYRTTWQPNTPYAESASITPQDINSEAVQLPQYWFVALNSGTSGALPPAWPTKAGVTVMDNNIEWACFSGVYPV